MSNQNLILREPNFSYTTLYSTMLALLIVYFFALLQCRLLRPDKNSCKPMLAQVSGKGNKNTKSSCEGSLYLEGKLSSNVNFHIRWKKKLNNIHYFPKCILIQTHMSNDQLCIQNTRGLGFKSNLVPTLLINPSQWIIQSKVTLQHCVWKES